MLIRNTTSNNIHKALEIANEQYKGNLKFKRFDPKGRGFIVTLTVKSSKEAGSRRSREGRRIAAACWHAHRDWMKALFELEPNTRITSAIADYNGKNDFENKYPETGNKNIGSIMFPFLFFEACECGIY